MASVPVVLSTALPVLLLGFAAVLLAGSTVRQLWTPAATAAGASLVLSQVVHTGGATGLVLAGIGAAMGLDQALVMLRQDRRRLRKLAARPHARHLLADRRRTTTGRPVVLAGAAVVVSTSTLHLAVHQAVSAIPADSPGLAVIAVAACLPALPAVLHRVRALAPGRPSGSTPRQGLRTLAVPHDPRAGIAVSAVVLFATAFTLPVL
jgi:uncharacterized membrane protein YdfJ with MMPL/SSD domain